MKTFLNLFAIVGLGALSSMAFAQLEHDASSAHKAAAQVSSAILEAELMAIHVQGICPVTGEALGSMGQPIKVQMGEQNVYLCCKDCVGKQAGAEHWQTIQANLVKAQGFCPVMEEALPIDAKSVVFEGRQVFVCCPECIEKIQAEPATFLAKVDALYAHSLGARHQAHAVHEQAEGQTQDQHKHDK